MYALVLIRYIRPLDEVLAATDAHRTYLRALHAQGVLLVSGPLEPRTGGVLLLRLPDDDPTAFDAIRDADPYWLRGLANYELLKWLPGIGAEGLDRL